MKFTLAIKWLIPLIFVLTLAAVLAGLWPGDGEPYPLTNFSRRRCYDQRPRPVLLGHGQFGGADAGQRSGHADTRFTAAGNLILADLARLAARAVSC